MIDGSTWLLYLRATMTWIIRHIAQGQRHQHMAAVLTHVRSVGMAGDEAIRVIVA